MLLKLDYFLLWRAWEIRTCFSLCFARAQLCLLLVDDNGRLCGSFLCIDVQQPNHNAFLFTSAHSAGDMNDSKKTAIVLWLSASEQTDWIRGIRGTHIQGRNDTCSCLHQKIRATRKRVWKKNANITHPFVSNAVQHEPTLSASQIKFCLAAVSREAASAMRKKTNETSEIKQRHAAIMCFILRDKGDTRNIGLVIIPEI